MKKNSPSWLFSAIRIIADNTLLKILPFIFTLKVISFRKRKVQHISFSGKIFDIVIDPKNGYLDKTIYADGVYEPHIAQEIINNIQKGDVCLDIGANIGYHTIIMSLSTGQHGKVIGYEPIPIIRKQLEETLTLNKVKNVSIIPDALSKEKGALDLFISNANIAGSSFINKDSTSIKVNLTTLDSYNYPTINFIKLDVEGFEYNVLVGGEKTITKTRPRIIFEFSPTYYRKSNPTDVKNILVYFTSKDYTLIDLEDGKKIITDIDAFIAEFNPGLRSQTNMLALPN